MLIWTKRFILNHKQLTFVMWDISASQKCPENILYRTTVTSLLYLIPHLKRLLNEIIL